MCYGMCSDQVFLNITKTGQYVKNALEQVFANITDKGQNVENVEVQHYGLHIWLDGFLECGSTRRLSLVATLLSILEGRSMRDNRNRE